MTNCPECEAGIAVQELVLEQLAAIAEQVSQAQAARAAATISSRVASGLP